MARYRLSAPARADIAHLLAISAREWGAEARRRYAATIASAMRHVASDPAAPGSRHRGDLIPGLRSLHLNLAPASDREQKVRRPVHVVYYRAVQPRLIEIVRVLHERMDADRQFPPAGP